MSLLEVHNLKAFYSQTEVLHGLTFSLREGGITTILGSNGAGKTTLLRAICGMIRTSGEIIFSGRSIAHKDTSEIARLGIAHVPEMRGTFMNLSVEENLRLGGILRKNQKEIRQDLDYLYACFPILLQRGKQQAGSLSGGEQQMLGISRALMMRPRLILLDEPSFGLAPLMVSKIFEIIRKISQEQKVTLLLVEQNASLALTLADHVHLLETGNIVLSGPSAMMQKNESIRRTYLGY